MIGKNKKIKTMKDIKVFNEVTLPLMISIIPSALIAFTDNNYEYLNKNFFNFGESIFGYYLILFLCFLLSIIIIRVFYFLRIKRKRDKILNKYVGKWIQYIPGFSRKISVCSIERYGDHFLFSGLNFGQEEDKGEKATEDDKEEKATEENNGTKETKVKFFANMYLDEYLEGYYARFHYKTDAHVVEKYNERVSGFGELEIYGTEATGLYTGDGYFYDVLSSIGKGQDDPIQLYSIVRFDTKFYNRIKKDDKESNKINDAAIRGMTLEQVYKKMKDLFKNHNKSIDMPNEGAIKAIKAYFENINKKKEETTLPQKDDDSEAQSKD